jgi:hypothetical protein
MIFSPQTAYAAEDSSQHETVKVGFFAMDGYHVMDEEGNRSGYGYDFLRLMARYWDVDYEYVSLSTSWFNKFSPVPTASQFFAYSLLDCFII